MKLYGVYSGDENRNKKIWQTENAKDISSIINMDSFFSIITFYLIPRKLTLTPSAWKDNCFLGPLSKLKFWRAILFERILFL